MTLFSADRASHLSHLLVDELEDLGLVQPKERGAALKKIKNYLDVMNQKYGDAIVRAEQKTLSTKKNLMPGSAEFISHAEKVFFEELHHKG